MQALAPFVFAIHALMIVAGALIAAFSTRLVRALMGLILTMVGVAGMYLLLNAPFVALMQLLIYVGAVAVLVFFAVMLMPTEQPGSEPGPQPMRKYLWAVMAAGAPLFGLSWVWLKHAPESLAVPPETPLSELGRGLMEDYILAFELISVVLFIAMSGAVLLAFRRRHREGDAS